jgi:hypothetical protein
VPDGNAGRQIRSGSAGSSDAAAGRIEKDPAADTEEDHGEFFVQPKTANGGRHLAVVSVNEGLGEAAPFDSNYWLARCEGYRVEGVEGRVGVVEEVRVGSTHPHDTVLAVRAGRLGRRVLLIRATSTAFIVPRAERIWLRTPVTIMGSEPAAHWRDWAGTRQR